MSNLETAEQEAIFNMKCNYILSIADEVGLQLEVVWSAFKHKEQFRDASLLECLQVGADEWDLDYYETK